MKKIIFYLCAAVTALSCLFGVSFFFISDSTLELLVADGLHLKIAPSFIGGEIAQTFFVESDVSDDIDFPAYMPAAMQGSGASAKTLSLMHEGEDAAKALSLMHEGEDAAKALSLMQYTVHQPVHGAKWQQSAEYWQLVLEYAGGPAVARTIQIRVAEEQPDDVLFTLEEWNGDAAVYSPDGEIIGAAQVMLLDDDRKCIIRVPLEDIRLRRLYSAEKTYHTVSTRTVTGRKASDDFCAEVDMRETKNASGQDTYAQDVIDAYKSLTKKRGAVQDKPENALGHAIFLFDTDRMDEAEELFAKILNVEPENPVALAYYGSCLASRGGKSSAFKAMKLVNEAYTYLDKAASLAYGTPEELDVLMNRAEVSAAVPQSIFKKAASGAADFSRITQLYASRHGTSAYTEEEKLFMAYHYVMASRCFGKCSKKSEEQRAVYEAQKWWTPS